MRRAFTVLELLVALAVAAALAGLLLPAVGRVREAASRLKCSNNLRQISLACLNYESANGVLPDAGHASRPGLFRQILPHCEGGRVRSDAAPFPPYVCPSRGGPRYKTAWFGTYFCGDYGWPNNAVGYLRFPAAVPGELCGGFWSSDGSTAVNFSGWAPQVWAAPPDKRCRAVWRPPVRLYEVTDGTANTVLVSEKALGRAYYDAHNQDTPVYGVGSYGTALSPAYPPLPDSLSGPWCEYFGSAHPGGVNAAFCDGSVRRVGYAIGAATWRAMCTRAGGEVAIQDTGGG